MLAWRLRLPDLVASVVALGLLAPGCALPRPGRWPRCGGSARAGWKWMCATGKRAPPASGRHRQAGATGKRAVEQGEVLGRVGRTGVTYGTHLHFELLLNGVRLWRRAATDWHVGAAGWNRTGWKHV